MTISPSKKANSNPLIPGVNDTIAAKPVVVSDGTLGGNTINNHAKDSPPVTLTEKPTKYPTNEPDAEHGYIANTASLTTVGEYQNQALMDMLNSDDYDLNMLNSLRQPAYKFRLFMTTEHELVLGAKKSSITELYKTLDSIPQVTIAESGVTVGFNIQEVEIEQACGPGFRNRSSYMTAMKMTIVEPMSASMMEAILNASMSLGIQNFAKVWYYVELSFHGYNEDGSINESPLKDMNLINGGRWVYQVAISNIAVHMDEGGATYHLTCVPYSMLAFEDDTCGRVPDVINVSGGTIKEFCDDLGKKLTQSWTDRYVGEIYKFNFVIKEINDDTEKRNPGNFHLKQGETDPIRNLSLKAGADKTPTGQIPRGTSINDLLIFLYSHCEEAQKMMLDTSTTAALEDGDGPSVNFNGKDYRVPIVPMIEADVKITGYDPVTGNYMKDITYTIWSYRSYTSNLCVSQFDKIKKDPRVATKIAKELKDRGYLKKRYEYRFTGLNTEVIRYDLDYNFAFSAVLPKLSGWRADANDVSDHEKRNESLADGASMKKEKNETNAKDAKNLTPGQIQEKLTQINDDITSVEDQLAAIDKDKNAINPKTNKPYTDAERKQLKQQLDKLMADRASLKQAADAARAASNKQAAQRRDEIEKSGMKNVYAEDAQPGKSSYAMTYIQAHDEASQASGNGFIGQWHRGSSLAGAVMNQLYEPVINALASISLEIRGDPFWIGYSHLERRAIISGGHTHDSKSVLPNYLEGDSTMALIFKFPSAIGDSGELIMRDDDVFNGLYRVTTVKSVFSGGEFRQTLQAMKLELITPILTNPQTETGGTQTKTSGTVEGN